MSKIFENDKIHLGLLLFKVRQKWYFFALILPTILVLSFFYARSLTRVYGFKSSIIISATQTGSDRPDVAIDATQIREKKINRDDVIGILKSYDMVRKTTDRLSFGVSYYVGDEPRKNERYGNFLFEVKPDSNSSQMVDVPIYIRPISNTDFELWMKAEDVRVYDYNLQEMWPSKLGSVEFKRKGKFNKPFKMENLNIVVKSEKDLTKFKGVPFHFTINNPDGIAKSYQGKLKVEPVAKESFILEMRTQGTVSQKEIDFLNKMMDVIIEEDLDQKNQKGKQSLEFINKQLDIAEQSLAQSQQSVESLESGQRIMNIDDISKRSTDVLFRLMEERSNLQLRLNSYRSIMTNLRSSPNLDQSIALSNYNIGDNQLNTMVNSLSKLMQDKAERSISETENSPTIVRLNNQIQVTRNNLEVYLDQNIQTSQNNLLNISQRIAQLEAQRTQLPLDNSRLTELRRDFDFNKRKYEELLDKRNEARLALATNAPDIRVVEKAKQQGVTPIKPNTKFIYMVAFLLGLGIPLGIVVVQDLFNDKVQSREDIREVSQIPVLGMIADGGKKIKLVSLQKPRSMVSESFRNLRVNIEQAIQNSGGMGKRIGITSTLDGEGKSYVAVNLGVSLARAKRKVCLLSGDLYKDQLKDYFDYPPQSGLSDYLDDRKTLEEIIHPTGVPNLDIIPGGTIPDSPQEMIIRPEMQRILENLRLQYDYVIMDVAPVGLVSDYFVLKNNLDLSLYLVRYNRTSKKLLQEISDYYEAERVKDIYVVLNGVKFGSMYEFQFKTGKHVYYQS